jgi:hypothetical protein
MQSAAWALMDTVSGAGVPVLFGVSQGDRWGNVGAVALGGVCGACLDLVGPGGPPWLRGCLALAISLVSLSFSAALLFRHAAGWDPDLGAALCGIPFFHAVCGPAARPLWPRGVPVFMSVVALALGASYALDAGGPRPGAHTGWSWVSLALCAAHATAQSWTEGRAPSPWASGLRVALLACVALWPGLAGALTLRRQDRVSMLGLGLALVTSATRQGRHAWQGLQLFQGAAETAEVRRARRALLLAVAWCLMVAYYTRWVRWEDAGWVTGALLLGRAACHAWG